MVYDNYQECTEIQWGMNFFQHHAKKWKCLQWKPAKSNTIAEDVFQASRQRSGGFYRPKQ
ncbi:hypothetical protein PAXRUDRAFT_148155 [Paxillus rubicundulus Ve08.2h10]|uniref:Uncharacterized protein n=1 Tax=Paxillus rubicundulus Ve08.2h10 TaxID=930991 RepID=A0A0D0E4A7_9AGAM|nr:hypothetical protein PAXRUDRAFT_148155 [Paxillus rubicundulus Ve08.2h10]